MARDVFSKGPLRLLPMPLPMSPTFGLSFGEMEKAERKRKMKKFPGHVRCRHCDGKTICDCAECGKSIERWNDTAGRQVKVWTESICQVCKGLGQIPIPKPGP